MRYTLLNFMNQMINNLKDTLPSEAMNFFIVFSRFEYALKRNKIYLKTKTGSNEAQADWDKFANDRGRTFLDHVRDAGQAGILLKNPPSKQIVENGVIDWEEASEIKSVQDLFGAIRRVRNNLFHGGKYPSRPVEEVARNKSLLSNALWVLEEALKASESVSKYFFEDFSWPSN